MKTAGRFVCLVAAFALVGAVAIGTRTGILTAQAGVLTSDPHTVLLDHFDGSTVGTAYGALSYAPSVQGLGQAGVFGPGTYVKYAMSPSTTNTGTVEMWIKPTSGLRTSTGLLNFNWYDTTSPPPSGWVLQMGISSSKTTPPNVPSASTATGASSVPLNQWSHLALTWSPTSTDLYLDGKLTGSGAGSPPDIAHNSYWVYLNYWGTAASGPFVGLIDELRISDIDRSAAEIAADATPGAATAYYNIAGPGGIATGPDGNLWFTNGSNDTIGKVTPAGVVTTYTGPGIAQPNSIASDGTSLWFTNNGFGGGDTIGRINPSTGVITSYAVSGLRALRGITLGPDGAMWFTSHGIPGIGRITAEGTITVYPNPDLRPEGITAGSDGGVWFTDDSGNIGRIDPTTKEFAMLFTSLAGTVRPTSIVTGPDGNLWFTNEGTQDSSGNQIDASIASISTSGRWAGGIYRDPGIIQPAGITSGPDGRLWFTNQSAQTVCPPCGTPSTIGQINPSTGQITYSTDSSLDQPAAITTGPDGALWFTNSGGGALGNSIGRITTDGTFSGPYEGNGMYAPGGLVSGPDGALWFTNSGGGSGNPNYSSIGRITTSGAISAFKNSNPPNWDIAQPFAITLGPDGNLWYTNNGWGGGDTIGRITPSGVVTSYPVGRGAAGITSGPDGALWFASPGGMRGDPAIGRITTGGTLTNVYTDSRMTGPQEITTGPDGALWFTDSSNQIGRITKGGSFAFFSNTGIQGPKGIATGPDGALWFTNSGTYDDQGNLTGGSSIGRITTKGNLSFFADTSIIAPNGITAGPDGALWFTSNGTIGRITTAGQVSNYPAVGVSAQPQDITTGPDGAVWFTEMNNVIGRIETAATPEITSFTPTSGTVGTKVTISGVNLGHASRVTFNGTVAAIVSNTSSIIVVRVPKGAQTGPITVTTSVGTATSPSPFTVT